MSDKRSAPASSPHAFGADAGEPEDAQLIRACVQGDQSSWDRLVDKYQRLVYAVPRRAGLDEDRASDIFQDVFLTLFQKIDTIDQPERVRAWLVTTAKFKTWSVIRGGRGFFAPADDEEMELEMASIRDTAPLADEVLVELEEQHMIRTAMGSLDERCRQILSLLYLRQPAATYAEVGQVIGVGETSISPLRSRCLKKLGKLL